MMPVVVLLTKFYKSGANDTCLCISYTSLLSPCQHLHAHHIQFGDLLEKVTTGFFFVEVKIRLTTIGNTEIQPDNKSRFRATKQIIKINYCVYLFKLKEDNVF